MLTIFVLRSRKVRASAQTTRSVGNSLSSVRFPSTENDCCRFLQSGIHLI